MYSPVVFYNNRMEKSYVRMDKFRINTCATSATMGWGSTMSNSERLAAMRARVEHAKDTTPSTSMFVWFVPAMVIMAVLCKTEAVKVQECFMHIAGYCL